MLFLETSALTGDKIEKAFDVMLKQIIEKIDHNLDM